MNARIVIENTSGLGKVDIPAAHKMWFKQRQIANHYDGLSAVYVTQSIVLVLFGASAGDHFTALTAAILVVATILIFAPIHFGARSFKRCVNPLGLASALRKIEFQGIVAGISWGALLGLHAVAIGSDQALFGLLIATILILGGITFGSVASASRNFLFSAAAGAALGHLVDGRTQNLWMAVFLLAFTFALNELIKTLYAGFASRLIRSRELQQAIDTVQLVLNDYEQQGADWLWEIDNTGLIVNPSPRFQEAIGDFYKPLSGELFLPLFGAGEERETLANFLASQQPFRDVSLALADQDGGRWWRISGRPHIDDKGLVVGMRGVATDVSAAKNAEAKVVYLAHYDNLTNLPNRRFFNEAVERAFARCDNDDPAALLYLDLDHFKVINDKFGHGVGDSVLMSAAARIEKVVGSKNMVARLGGDEFAVLLPRITSTQDVCDLARQVSEALAAPILVDGQSIQSGASIGISFAPMDANCADQFIKNADLALYDAKRSGRGTVSVFDISMHDAMEAKRLVEIDLRTALTDGDLELYYQPLVNVDSGKIVGYEALLRWHHPERGLIMPDMFIPIAEETGLIVTVGEWVIRSALNEAQSWPTHLSVSVNLSPAQLRSPNLIPTVLHALAASGVDPHRLEMEITETVLMQDSDANLEALYKLRDLGIKIALDDFGTGYSSLNYLRSFPFDKIKIDRCFIEDVVNREDCRAIVRAVSGLAKSMGMTTTAEGVERLDQLEELKREGCSEAQGFYFSKAIPAGEIAGRIAHLMPQERVSAVVPLSQTKLPASIAAQDIRKAS